MTSLRPGAKAQKLRGQDLRETNLHGAPVLGRAGGTEPFLVGLQQDRPKGTCKGFSTLKIAWHLVVSLESAI